MVIPRVIGLSLLVAATPAFAANCYTDQPFQGGIPSPGDVATILEAQVQDLCKGAVPVMEGLKFTEIYGGLNLTIGRTSAGVGLGTCNGAFGNIIADCIQSSFWGGWWSDNGVTYRIANQVS
jgi:hypothetical protein